MVAAAEVRKKQDEENKVEGRENIDYSVPRRRKKPKPEESLETEKHLDPLLVEWVKEKLETLGGFDENKHWNEKVEEAINQLLTDPTITKLFLWTSGDHV